MVILDNLVCREGLDGIGVTEGAKAVLAWVLECPMGSVNDYVALGCGDPSSVYSRLLELQAVGLVVWDETVEGVFHRVGAELGMLMLTTTMERLRRYGPAGNSDCWPMYGRRVYLGAW